jgi:hypothetical protein
MTQLLDVRTDRKGRRAPTIAGSEKRTRYRMLDVIAGAADKTCCWKRPEA